MIQLGPMQVCIFYVQTRCCTVKCKCPIDITTNSTITTRTLNKSPKISTESVSTCEISTLLPTSVLQPPTHESQHQRLRPHCTGGFKSRWISHTRMDVSFCAGWWQLYTLKPMFLKHFIKNRITTSGSGAFLTPRPLHMDVSSPWINRSR